MRRLERHVDWDLVDRIEANGPVQKVKPHRMKKTPRPAATYRGAKRNATRALRAAGKAARRERAAAGYQEDHGGAEGAL